MEKKMYVRLCDTLNDKGILIPENENIYNHIKNKKKDYYTSVYKYNEEQKKIFDKTGTITGITEVTTDLIIFDFDSKDLEEARNDTKILVQRLIEEGIADDFINIYFSGGKGFHVTVLTDDEFTPEQHKKIALKFAGDLTTWDNRVYNGARVFRVPNTRHKETKLYKTQIELSELIGSSIDEIKGFASEDGEIFSPIPTIIPAHIKEVLSEQQKETSKPSNVTGVLNLLDRPKFLSPWKYGVLQGYFPEGTQNDAIMILASTFKANKFDLKDAFYLVKSACDKQAERFNKEPIDDDDIEARVEKVYEASWNGGQYSEDNFPKKLQDYLIENGIPRKKQADMADLQSVDEVYDTFENYAENIDMNTVKTGIKDLDKICRITTSMLVGLLGCPAAGKTASVLNILNKMSKGGEESVFFSLDMGKPLVYQKFAQRFTGKSGEEIFDIFKNKEEEEKTKIKKLIADNYKNVKLCFKTSSTVDDMRQYIVNYQETTGKKLRLVVVDYLEKVVGPFSDATANAGAVAKQLQELANDLELCVIVLLQPQKIAGTPADPITSYRRIKGASIIEQDCRVIISLWREGYASESYENDNFITYAVLKNTMGALGKVDCGWEGKTGRVYDLEDIQRQQLKELREWKREKKANEEFDI
jgi:hypothetical protein